MNMFVIRNLSFCKLWTKVRSSLGHLWWAQSWNSAMFRCRDHMDTQDNYFTGNLYKNLRDGINPFHLICDLLMYYQRLITRQQKEDVLPQFVD